MVQRIRPGKTNQIHERNKLWWYTNQRNNELVEKSVLKHNYLIIRQHSACLLNLNTMKNLYKTVKFQLLNSELEMDLGYLPVKTTMVSGKTFLKSYPKGFLVERKHKYLQTQFDVTGTGHCLLLVFDEFKQFVTVNPYFTSRNEPLSIFISDPYVVLIPYDWQLPLKNMESIEIFELHAYEKKIKTYTFPKQFISGNGITLPSYLGLGILNSSSINETDPDMVTADYYEQCDGSLTDKLVYKVSVGNENATVYKYFEEEIYKVTTEKKLELAFYKSFVIKGKRNLMEDKPMYRFAEEVMKMGAHTFLYSTQYFYFPAGLIVRLVKPLLNESDKKAWLKFQEKYNNATDDKTILKKDHSPFSSIYPDGKAVVFPVFLKDAISLLKKENLLGDTKESAVQVFYT